LKEEAVSEHITAPRTCYVVFAILIGLTIVTVSVSFLDIGDLHLPIGLSIGVVKAALVTLFFMGLLHHARLNWVIVASGLVWLGILILLTLSDYLTRT
jgi:cytochrome c oxidase subunit 4